jgi:sugar phosphate isomerase/epimerase
MSAMSDERFGLSTHLFHEQRLSREHVSAIGGAGFHAIELFATRAHFDYEDAHAIDELAGWLRDSGLSLHSMHAPIYEAGPIGQTIGSLSTASGDERRRIAAVDAARAALQVARSIPFRFLVVHLGVPGKEVASQDNRSDAARRSLEAIVDAASLCGVRVAVEVITNGLSESPALVRLIEEDLEGLDVGICLDYGHAHLMGDLGDSIEAISGHLWTTHVHDNHGRIDDHLVPYAGTINWDAAMMATQKIGYEGVLMFEVAGHGNPPQVLERTVKARGRLEKTFVTF